MCGYANLLASLLIQSLSIDEAYISSRCLNVNSISIYVSQSNYGPLSSLSASGLKGGFRSGALRTWVEPMVRFRPIGRTLNWTYNSVLKVVTFHVHSFRTLNRTVIFEKHWTLYETYRLHWLHIHSIPFLDLNPDQSDAKASRCRAAWNMSWGQKRPRGERVSFLGVMDMVIKYVLHSFFTASLALKPTLIKNWSQGVYLWRSYERLSLPSAAKTANMQIFSGLNRLWCVLGVYTKPLESSYWC